MRRLQQKHLKHSNITKYSSRASLHIDFMLFTHFHVNKVKDCVACVAMIAAWDETQRQEAQTASHSCQ